MCRGTDGKQEKPLLWMVLKYTDINTDIDTRMLDDVCDSCKMQVPKSLDR